MNCNAIIRLVAIFISPALAAAYETEDCLILPGKTVDVGSTIPGKLSQVAVDLDTEVVKGQIIASLQTEVQEAVLELAKLRAENTAPVAAARARLEYEKKELERAQRLRKQGVLPDANIDERLTAFQVRKLELEEAEMDLQLAKLEKLRAEAELEIRRIRAPIDGIVADRALDPGEYLRDDGKVATLVQLDPLHVEVFLPQVEYERISVGDLVTVTPDLLSETDHVGVIDAIDPIIDAASATFRVRLELANPDHRIVAGVRCTASF